MDFLKNATSGSDSNKAQTGQQQQQQSSGGGGLMDKLNSMAGGGKASEKNEDALDKGVDAFQEHVLGQGKQDNESALEQAKDEQIAGFIRGQTGYNKKQ